MKISDILSEELIVPTLQSSGKEEALRELSDHICRYRHDISASASDILSALSNRERLGSTGVGEGVAIPHAKLPGLKSLVACFGRAPHGVAFDAMDQQPVHLLFVLLVPENSAGAHLKALARISRLLKDGHFRSKLMTLPDHDALYQAFLHEDAKR